MKKIAICGIMTTTALIFSFIETLIPLSFVIPGIKLGLANIVVIFSLYKLGTKEAILISLVRVMLAAFLFGSFSSMVYAVSGAVFSIVAMVLLKKMFKLHVITVSICGAISHIIGQLMVAGAVVGYEAVTIYLAPLLLAAFVTGAIVGVLGNILIGRIPIDNVDGRNL